jgi:Inhibitor of apoptosis-promoting Bax1
MGLIGVVIASLVNIFLASSTLQFVVSIVGILVFVGLTAWDTQSIKEQYAENFDAESQQKLAVFGAFSLYLNFINIFQLLLKLHRPAGRMNLPLSAISTLAEHAVAARICLDWRICRPILSSSNAPTASSSARTRCSPGMALSA